MKWREIPTAYPDRLAHLRALLERDPFAVLGVTEAATAEQVKLAYRRCISAYHPDRQDAFIRSYAQEVTKIMNLAYEQICAKRKA